MKLLLQAKDLSMSLGSRQLFADLEFSVGGGDRLGLVGHNGSGKTTLLRILSGELPPDRGEIIRRRQLRMASVEQFLPVALEAQTLVAAVADKVAPDEHWRAEATLSDMGFDTVEFSQQVNTLSGGQLNRLMLARALVAEPELLLLDEPTNHLDLATLLVFEKALTTFPGALVLVSHDREFLDVVTSETLVLRDERIYRFSASYSEAMALLLEMDAAHARTRAEEERKIAALRASAKRLAVWGKVYDNEKLAKRAKAMEKRVERLEEDRTFVTRGSPLDLALPLGETRARQVLAVERCPVTVADRQLYWIEELILRPGDRVALLGGNGAGKTTFIRQLMAVVDAGNDPSGAIRISPQTSVGYYDQELQQVSGEGTMLLFACRRTHSAEQQVRTRLIRAGFPYEVQTKQVSMLSGGERARLLFVVHALNQPNFLIMDEPTNHIDIDGKEQLEDQLLTSGATLLITSHDRRFLSRIANRYLWIRDGALVEITGLEAYFEDAVSAASHGGEGQKTVAAAAPAVTELDSVLEQILHIEQKLEADQARKKKFQKPQLQATWRDQLETLYSALEAAETPSGK